jgi:hypothetical protein
MRAAALMSALAVAAVIPLLVARRQWAPLLGLCLVLIAGWIAHGYVHGDALGQKVASYAPTSKSRAGEAALSDPSYAATCIQRVKLETGRTITSEEARYSCNYRVQLSDYDGRMRLILYAVEHNVSRLFGSGLGSYLFADAGRSDAPVGRYDYPHNLVVEVFHISGLMGLGLLGITAVIGASIALRAFMVSDRPIAVVIAIPVFTLLASLVGGDLYDGRLLWLMPVVIGAFASCDERKPAAPCGTAG